MVVDEGLRERIVARIAAEGPLPFSAVMDVALYDPLHGFYATGGRAGRRGDFLTSPEVGPLFGAVVARALDTWWDELGRPARFTVVEAGAGPGTLARTVLAAEPRCLRALRYVLVEQSEAQRQLHDGLHGIAARTLVEVESRDTLPTLPEPCVVLANELLDNLPVDLYERTAAGWAELRVAERGGELAGVLVPLSGGPDQPGPGQPGPDQRERDEPGVGGGEPDQRGRDQPGPGQRGPDEPGRGQPGQRSAQPGPHELDRLAPGAPVGARVPWQSAARHWLRAARALAGAGGRVVVWDYASTTAELAARPIETWLRTYRGHQRGGHPLEELGGQDVTCEVAEDQLALLYPPSAACTQAEWLRAHGIDELVEDARLVWQTRAAIGDLEAMKARSRVNEAQALLDPGGLGGFRVLEWRSPTVIPEDGPSPS